MANELIINYPSGSTLYALLFDATGNVWNGSSFVAPGSAAWTDYDIAMSEIATATGIYHGTMPAAVAGVYSFVVRKQTGGSPAVSDVTVGIGRIEWTGTAEIMPASTTNIETINSVSGTVGGVTGLTVADVASAILATPAYKIATVYDGSITISPETIVSAYVTGLSPEAQQDVSDALTSEPAQLDWRAWVTPDGTLADLYDDNAIDELTHSGTTLTAEGDTGFAAWVLQEFDGKLFVGVGKTPMNHIAAVIGSLASAGATPTFEYALPEEGVAAMCVGTDGKLYVAGVDERANTGDSSIYVRTTAGAWTRKQTITGWQHICGIREDGALWIAGQGASSILMRSDDGGDTWTDTDLTLGRAYDVIRLGAYVIATHWDGATTYTVHRSPTTPAFSWSPVSGIEGGTGRMVEWQGVIVGAAVSGKLFTVDSGGSGLEYTPPFTLRQTYNNLAVDTDGYLCVLSTTGVWRTNDLATWKQVWSFSPADTVRALGIWGDNLVVSTDGATAQVLARPASPEAAAQQMYRDALKLAASPGTAATGSTDADLADILTDTAAIKAITDDIDVSAVTLATGNNAGDLTFIVGATFDETLTGLTVIPDDWTACYFSLKREKDSDSDSASLIQVKVTNGGDVSDGLLYVQGSAPTGPITKANASLTVTQAAGTVRIVVSAAAMAMLTGGLSSLDWDLKVFRTGGWSKVVTSGNAQIAWTPTRAV